LLVRKIGEGCANLLEPSVLSCNEYYKVAWQRDVIDPTVLARKRWVEKWTMERLAEYFGVSRTAVVRHLGLIRKNPSLISDGRVRMLIHPCRRRFMGDSGNSHDLAGRA
jgi:hypothetical protein